MIHDHIIFMRMYFHIITDPQGVIGIHKKRLWLLMASGANRQHANLAEEVLYIYWIYMHLTFHPWLVRLDLYITTCIVHFVC